ncbi:MAG: efflux RND transporter permease subunit [Saprospiraceae bacterium]|nr:efflux RND transporter permease subunit [Saprospiraceae bacterium]
MQFVIQTPIFDSLKSVVPKFLEKARESKVFQAVDINLKFNKPELKVEIDRNRAAILGVSIFEIAQTLQLYFAEQRLGFFIKDGKQYQVIGVATRNDRNDPARPE